jgi:hypothetical protein
VTEADGRATVYSLETKGKALALVTQVGLARAHHQSGIPKSTLQKWAIKAGIETASPEARKRVEKATQASVLSRRQTVEEARERMTLVLATIAELAGREEIRMIQSGRVKLYELVGARTRALHDLQLLTGQATERPEIVESVDDVVALREQLRSRLGA